MSLAARLVLVSGIVISGCAATPAFAEDPYYLAPGDRVGITVFDQPDLSGTYLVEPNGDIAMPLIGPLNVTSWTPQSLQGELVSRFANGYLQNPMINVRLSELRPTTIVGEVRAPGRYTYIDGMTVEAGIALAGGNVRATSEETVQRLDMLRSEERLRSLTLEELSQRARKARLEAQVKGAASFEVVDSDPHNAEVLKQIYAGERRIFDSEVAAQASQIALLTQQMHTLEADSQSFEQQVILEKQQVDILDHQITDVSGLLANGLTRRSPVQDMQREKARTQSSLSRVLGELARAKSALAEANLKIQDVGSAYHNRLATDLQSVDLLLDATENALPLAREDLRLRTERLPFATKDDTKPQVLRISRYRKGVFDTFEADAGTLLRPGDILQVGRGAGGGGTATMSSRLPEPGAIDTDRPRTGTDKTSSANSPTAPGVSQLSQR
jgi:polysaccharide export outer membrane protein